MSSADVSRKQSAQSKQNEDTKETEETEEKKPEEKKKKNISEAEEISNRLKELAKQFGVDVEVHETLDTIDNKEARAEIKKGSIVNGFYSKGKIHLVVPSLMMDGGISRAEEVFVHEVVVHHGLMKILSAKGAERWNEFRDNIWAKMSVGDRIRYRNYVKDTVREGTSEEEIRRIAAEEYLAAMAEGFASDVLTETEKTIFDDIVQLLLDFMKAIGLHMTEKSCKDLLVAVASQMREEAKKNNAESETETEEKSEPKDNVEDTDNEDVDANNKPKGNPKSEPKSEPKTKTESKPKDNSDKEVIEEETTEQKKAESKQEEQKEIKEDKKEIEDKPTEKQKRVRYKTVKPLVQQEKRKLFNERIKNQGVEKGKVSNKPISLYDAVGKDPFKPALTGVYHDPTSLSAVAANGHILIIDKTSYDDNYRGQIIDKNGKAIEYTYPKYEIVYKNGGPRVSSNNVDFKELLRFINGAKTKVKKGEKDKDGNIYPFVHLGLRDNAGNVESYNVEMLETLVRHAIRMGLDKLEFYDFVNDSYRLDAVGKNGRIVIVPTPIEFYHAYDLLDNGRTRFSKKKSIEEVNERFNEELQQQINGTLPKGHVYQLGMPSEILRSCGFPNMPIELSSTNLAEHARKTHHPFELKDVIGLVNALQKPIGVFAYGDKNKSQNVIVEIQKDGRNFLVGIHFNQNRRGLVVSDIRGIFPKDNAEWLNWIIQGKSLYLDKEKIQTLINQQRKTLAEVEYLDLDYVTSVINNFENPKFSDGKVLFSKGTQFVDVGNRELMAIHNIKSDILKSILSSDNLLINPSFAIRHADKGFRTYGDISLILSSNMAEQADHIYADDAYTPMVPENLINSKREERELERLKTKAKESLFAPSYYEHPYMHLSLIKE